MAKNIKLRLAAVEGNLEESIRSSRKNTERKLTPQAHPKDIGRKPDRSTGKIDINQVVADSRQPRTEFSQESIERLAQSIIDKGQLSPIKVMWREEERKWVVLYGERRWRATKHAGLSTINCIFCETDLTRSEILEERLIENIQREDFKPLEKAKAFLSLMEMNDWTAQQVAESVRVHPSTVTRSLALLKLSDEMMEDVENGKLSARTAAELAKIKDEGKRSELAEKAKAGELTKEDAAKSARQFSGKKAKKCIGTRESFRSPNGIKITVACNRAVADDEVVAALKFTMKELRSRSDVNRTDA